MSGFDLSFENEVIRASAGSGKTFRLTNRYLKLILAGVEPETILATTFTRKAAGEILDRVFFRLARAALTEEACRRLSAELYGAESFLNRNALLAAVEKLARQMHRLRVMTLDSYFANLAGGFAPELGLPNDWRIVEQVDYARNLRRAILLALADIERGVTFALLYLLFQGESSRSLTKEIYDLALKMFPLCRTTAPEVWKALPRLKMPEKEVIAEAIERLRNAPLPTKGKKGEPDGNFLRERNKLVEAAETENWELFAKKKLVGSVLDESRIYYSKRFDDELAEAIDALLDVNRALIIKRTADRTESTRTMLERVGGYFESVKYREKGYRFDDLAILLSERLREINREQIVHRTDAGTRHLLLDEFQDTSILQWTILLPLVESIIQGDPSKTDAENSAENSEKSSSVPLVERQVVTRGEESARTALATSARKSGGEHGSVFAVGDVKQAIYGWRGGVAELFDELEKTLALKQTIRNDENRRSSPVILETVNALFSGVGQNSLFFPEEKPSNPGKLAAFRAAAELWQTRFGPHRAVGENQHYSGYAALIESPEEDAPDKDAPNESAPDTEISDEPDDDTEARFIADRIAETRARLGGERSIGVLVRENEMIDRIVSALERRPEPIEASLEGGVPLAGSPAVRAILSAIRLGDHPGETVAACHLAYLPEQAERFGLTPENFQDVSLRIEVSRRIRRTLAERGLPAFIRQLAAPLAKLGDRRDAERLAGLLKTAVLYTASGTPPRWDHFVETASETKIESPAAENLRVMTIHGAKGLEFDAVILPELDKTIDKISPIYVLLQKNAAAPIEAVLRYISDPEQPFLPKRFQKAFYDHHLTVMEESLNLLYVAITRARRELTMIVPPEKPKKVRFTSFCWANLLRRGLGGMETPPGGAPLWESGERDWFERDAFAPKKTERRSNSKNEGGTKRFFFAESAADGAELSDMESVGGGTDYEETMKTESANAVLPPSSHGSRRTWINPRVFERGSAIHRCFETIRWLNEEAEQEDSAGRTELEETLHREFSFSSSKAARTVDDFYRLCAQPEIRSLLTRSSYRQPGETPVHSGASDTRLEVFAERPYLLASEDGTVRRGTIDRLVLLRREDRVIGADIIDYKTDRFWDDSQKTLLPVDPNHPKVTGYFHQLREYRRAVERLFRLPPEKISLRLAFVSYDLILSAGAQER